MSYREILANPKASVFRTRDQDSQRSLSCHSPLALTPVEPEPSRVATIPLIDFVHSQTRS